MLLQVLCELTSATHTFISMNIKQEQLNLKLMIYYINNKLHYKYELS